MPYGKKYSEHMPFGKGSGNNSSPCFCFKDLIMPICSATDTVYYSSQEEESCQHSHARNTSARKVPCVGSQGRLDNARNML